MFFGRSIYYYYFCPKKSMSIKTMKYIYKDFTNYKILSWNTLVSFFFLYRFPFKVVISLVKMKFDTWSLSSALANRHALISVYYHFM